MKKKFILVPFIGILLYFTMSSYSEGPFYDSGGSIDGTGARGSTTGCSTGSTCHTSGATSSTAVTVQLLSGSTPVTSYVPGTTYTLKISGVNNSTTVTNLGYFGFEMCVVKASGAGSSSAVNAGTYGTAPSGTHTQTISGFTMFEQYNGGSPAAIAATTGSGSTGTTYVESISWTAPAAGTGSVVVYGVINAVNHDGAAGLSDGDLWNTASPITITEACTTAAITGTLNVCPGSTTTLSDASTGGVWSSLSPTIASVGSTGIVSGVATAGGTATINYTTSCGTASVVVTVNPAPSAISGTLSVCSGATTSLTDAGGSFTTGSSIATVTSGGVVSGVTGASGIALITYTLSGTGCTTTSPVTVNLSPAAFTGTSRVCQGATTTLGETVTGGSWSSGSTGVATVVGGLVSGVLTGSTIPATAVITYTMPGACSVSTTVTVYPLPAAITGSTNVCPGLTTTLSDASAPGTWVSGSSGIAGVGSSTGVVTGIAPAGGSSVITFTSAATGCSASTTVSVNAAPATITGSLSVCPGTTSLLSDGGGGTWLSGSTGIASISSGGLVTGVATTGGTSIITYTIPATGCIATAVVTVSPTPAAISGSLSVCQGASATLTDGTGTWSSATTGVATIASATGVVTGVVTGSTSPATSVITFTAPGGCSITAIATINPIPAAITGTTGVCVGSSTTLSDATSSGTWTSSDGTIAGVGSASGTVTGSIAGPVAITYTLPVTGCAASYAMTVNPLPLAISGVTSGCIGTAIALSDAGGGTWTSSDVTTATVGPLSGSVTGVGTTGGTVTITYALPVTGCTVTTPFTVNPLPAAVSGSSTLCAGGSVYNFTDVGSGTWASSNTTVAPIGSISGTVTTGATSTATTAAITFSLATTGCSKTMTVTVNPLPAAISGASQVCTSHTTSLTDAGGGTWLSSDGTTATINSASGLVTGIAPGTVSITYTLPTGCSRSVTETVNASPSTISGTLSLCQGSTTTLSDGGSGVWSSSAPGIASAGSSSGIITGNGPGTATITYTLAGGCATSVVVTVNPVSGITGLSSMCSGLTTTLFDGTTGGTWTSSNTSVATIGSGSGFVNSLTSGITTISYSLITGCTATTTLNVISSPATISGSNQVCFGITSALTDAGGGVWSSSAPGIASIGSASGLITGTSLGTARITYSLGTGCTVTMPVTVDALPAAIGGLSSRVCVGSSITLTDAGGGTWSSGDPTIATVAPTSGSVTGVSANTVSISYTALTGCSVSKLITVNPLPASIGGSVNICVGTVTSLTDGTSGGVWSSSAPGVASIVSGSGSMTGVLPGATTISYALTATGCTVSVPVSVNSVPTAISGLSSVCEGSSVTLSDVTPGGAWSTASTGASVGSSSGIVTGVTGSSSALISYTTPSGCNVTKIITVNPLPGAITGTLIACIGTSSALSDPSGGGVWSDTSGTVATIASGTGVATGVTVGNVLITYTLPTGCAVTALLTVNPAPAAISGPLNVCAGSTSLLTESGAGAWSAAPSTIAVIDPATGILTGVAGGTANVTYTFATGCSIATPFTVNSLPTAISGASTICVATPVIFTDGGTGTWSSSDITMATVDHTTGIVTGVSVSTPVITYTLPTGCLVTKSVTVNPLPAAIAGTATVCAGSITSLSDGTGSGTWSSDGISVAKVGSASGDVTGISAGTAIISYTIPTGCAITTVITVDPLPAAIAGALHVCVGATGSLTDDGGGIWSSSASGVVSIDFSTGAVTAAGPGTTTITYALPSTCATTTVMTVDAFPVAGTITGTMSACPGAAVVLADVATGGSWSSAHSGIATVAPLTGRVSAIAAGVDSIMYVVTNFCGTASAVAVVTVNPLADAGAISGATIVCMGTPATLTDGASGGTWSSSNGAIATVNPTTGEVSGVSVGLVRVSYTVTNVCNTAVASVLDTVIAAPFAGTIAGEDSVCQGETLRLTDPAIGGIWSTVTGNASVSATGVVTGVAAGIDTVHYSVTTVCGVATASLAVKVRSVGSCNVGVQQVQAAAGFNVYPNPSNGSFTVAIPATENGATITICDVLGKVIDRREISDNNAQLSVFNLSNAAPGNYIIKVDAGNMTWRDKIVIW